MICSLKYDWKWLKIVTAVHNMPVYNSLEIQVRVNITKNWIIILSLNDVI